jgi:hypothetical protein
MGAIVGGGRAPIPFVLSRARAASASRRTCGYGVLRLRPSLRPGRAQDERCCRDRGGGIVHRHVRGHPPSTDAGGCERECERERHGLTASETPTATTERDRERATARARARRLHPRESRWGGASARRLVSNRPARGDRATRHVLGAVGHERWWMRGSISTGERGWADRVAEASDRRCRRLGRVAAIHESRRAKRRRARIRRAARGVRG